MLVLLKKVKSFDLKEPARRDWATNFFFNFYFSLTAYVQKNRILPRITTPPAYMERHIFVALDI